MGNTVHVMMMCCLIGLYLSCLLLRFLIVAGIFFFFVCFEFVVHEAKLHSTLLDGQLTTALVPTYSLLPLCSPLQSPRLEKHFDVLFFLIRFIFSKFLSEVDGRVGHGLVLAWLESCVLCLVF